jgi:hypothetical protein
MATTATDTRADAIAWLRGRLDWDQYLDQLRDRADADGHPVELEVVSGPAEVAARQAA